MSDLENRVVGTTDGFEHYDQRTVTIKECWCISSSTKNADREFLFSYHFGGETWGTSVFAADEAEAREKIKAVGMARYDGELMMRIPAALPGAGWFTRLMCWWRNPCLSG